MGTALGTEDMEKVRELSATFSYPLLPGLTFTSPTSLRLW